MISHDTNAPIQVRSHVHVIKCPKAQLRRSIFRIGGGGGGGGGGGQKLKNAHKLARRKNENCVCLVVFSY